MGYLYVSENYENSNNIIYIRENLSPTIFKQVEHCVSANKFRVLLSFLQTNDLPAFVNDEIIDKIADVIAIAYKYQFFAKRLKFSSLNSIDRDLLITSLISADLMDDKRYIRSKIDKISQTAIDGVFNFRLKPLKRKWEEICSYVPEFFTARELKDFTMYLINERKGKRIYIDGNNAFDKAGNKLNKSTLLPNVHFSLFKEILISSANSIEIKSLPTDVEELNYINEYFGDKILFKSSENL